MFRTSLELFSINSLIKHLLNKCLSYKRLCISYIRTCLGWLIWVYQLAWT
jgi:hypothetical protein